MSELLQRSPLWSQPPLAVAANVVSFLAFVVIAGAIAVDFRNYYRQSRRVVSSDRSFVETGSMTVFFIAYYLVIRLRWFEVDVVGASRIAMIAAGLILMAVGVAFNVYGRMVLKSSWANQITIFEGQRLSTTGPFAVVRHPLYASLIWIFVGGALVYSNLLSFLITVGVFVPMMYVRAKKEDALLLGNFGAEYTEYKGRTGMFLPKVGRR